MKSEEKNIDFQYILSTLPPQAERLYHSKILLNICSAILLIAGSLAAPAFWWVQNNYYAGHFFWWALLAQWNIVHWLASCLLTVPALVILWGKRTFWRYFLQVYPILLIIAGAAATLLWYRDDYHRMSDNILPVWMVYLIIALTSLGIVYCASSKELWGNNVFTLHQLKLLAAHQQKLTILTKEKFCMKTKSIMFAHMFLTMQ